MIRPAQPADIARLREITAEVFGPSAVDFYIEEKFGQVAGRDWKWRKSRHIDEDHATNPKGIQVWEEKGEDGSVEIIGYVTVILDRGGSIGRIPNMAVAQKAQNRGIGRQLLNAAIDYIKAEGMELAKIETLIGNEVGMHLYPAMGFEEVARQIHYVKKL